MKTLVVAFVFLGGTLDSASSLSSIGFRVDGIPFNDRGAPQPNQRGGPVSVNAASRELQGGASIEEQERNHQPLLVDTGDQPQGRQGPAAYRDLLAASFQPRNPKHSSSSTPMRNRSNASDDWLGSSINGKEYSSMVPNNVFEITTAATTTSSRSKSERGDMSADDPEGDEEDELVLPFSATRTAPGVDVVNPVVRPIAFTSDEPGISDSFNAATPTSVGTVAARRRSPPPMPRPSSAGSSSTELRMQASTSTDSQMGTPASAGPLHEGGTNLKSDKNDDGENLFFADEPFLGDGSTVSERMLRKVAPETQTGGAGGVSSLDGFKRAEANWARLKAFKPFQYDKKLLRWKQDGHGPPPQFVATDGAFGSPRCWAKLRDSIEKELDFDVVVCGGTLGIFFATCLQLQGYDVCVIEAGKLRGREQEWNISMEELLELLELGILTQDDIDAVIMTEFPACRSGFKNEEVTPLKGGYFENGIGYECLTPDVLNLGVAPSLLLERVAKRFTELGGVIKEQTRLSGVCVSELIGSALDLGENEEPVTARLVLDCMGNASPISAQQRYGKKADGICAVVGSCAGGYDKATNLYGDIIYTNQPIVTRNGKGSNQYFWEAFPVGIGRGVAPGTSDVKTTVSTVPSFVDSFDSNNNRNHFLTEL
jgi:hypothetical protein